jgi:hypothetical protein
MKSRIVRYAAAAAMIIGVCSLSACFEGHHRYYSGGYEAPYAYPYAPGYRYAPLYGPPPVYGYVGRGGEHWRDRDDDHEHAWRHDDWDRQHAWIHHERREHEEHEHFGG